MKRNLISLSDIPPAPRPKLIRNRVTAPVPAPPPTSDQVIQSAKQLGPCTTEHVLSHLGHSVTRANEMVVATTLRRLGYSRIRMMIKGVRAYVFYPPAERS